MRTEFRIKPHDVRPGAQMVEVHIDGVFIAAIYGMDTFPGLNVTSKFMQTDGIVMMETRPPSLIIPLTAR